MTPQQLLLEVFCLVDDQPQALDLGRLRQRGPYPTLADSEVITIELVGAFCKLDADTDLFRHCRQHYARDFPALAHLDRTPFTRQAANLWRVKQLLQQRLAAGGVTLLASYYHKSKDPDRRRSAQLAAVRYRVETVNGQLAVR
ncbi:MAG: hypothetical protein L0Z62_44725 [Gemmataceae bacterium]|nr:hypothetical protein [Gemmataceae bacterium]